MGIVRKSVIDGILGLAAIYGVAAVSVFMLRYNLSDGSAQVPATLVYCGIVLIPYALLALAVYLAPDRKALLWVGGAGAPVVLLSLWFYSGSFGPNDGEYVLFYMVTPMLQSPLALIALGMSLRGRRRTC